MTKGWKAATLAGALALLAAACGSDNAATTTTTASVTTGGGQPTTSAGANQFKLDTSKCGPEATAKVSGTIKLGTSLPQAGPFAGFASVGQGLKAYYDYANEANLVPGIKFELLIKDDGYDPSKTKANVQEMVEQDKVFGFTAIVGTPNNAAIREDLNLDCVPHLWAGTGDPRWGDLKNFPWTTGSILSYATESAAYASKINTDFPTGTKVATLRVNNDFGKAYDKGFKDALAKTKSTIVSEQILEPTDTGVQNQVTTLAASGADVFFNMASGALCTQTMAAVKQTGWALRAFYQSATCVSISQFFAPVDPAGEGVITAAQARDPSDPRFANDADVKLYIERLAKVAPSEKPGSSATFGWTYGALTIEAFKRAATSPEGITRASVMTAARNLSAFAPPLGLPGVTVNMNALDGYPTEALRLQQYSATDKRFVYIGELINLEGQTKLTP